MGFDLTGKFKSKTVSADKSGLTTSTAINPQYPISSLAAGNNQFTAIADTNHASGDIFKPLIKEIPRLAQTGVKHIMLEYTINPVGSPYRKDIDPYWENLLARINSRPPQITETEILQNKDLLNSDLDKDGKNGTGLSIATLMVDAMKHGIKVHFAGDYLGYEESLVIMDLEESRDQYLKKHRTLQNFAEKMDDDPAFLQKLKWPQGQKDKLLERLIQHRDWLNANSDALQQTLDQLDAKRMGPEAEATRADRFIKLAQGQKAVVVFGNDHYTTTADLNEAIDNKLRMDALKKGTPLPGLTPIVQIWENRDELRLEEQRGGDLAKLQKPSVQIFANTGEIHIPEKIQHQYKAVIPAPPAAAVGAPGNALAF